MSSSDNTINSFQNVIYTSLDACVSLGCQVSKELEAVKVINKAGLAVLKAGSYVPAIANNVPIAAIETPLKDIKTFSDFFMGFRSLDALLKGNFAKNWKVLALNVSGLALMFFTTISGLGRMGVDVSLVTNLAKQVPVFGVLPFAGLLNLSLATMFGMLYLMARDAKAELEEKKEKVPAKLQFWSNPIDESLINARIHKYREVRPNPEKLQVWQKIQTHSTDHAEQVQFLDRQIEESRDNKTSFDKNTQTRLRFDDVTTKIQEFSAQKHTKWEKKLEKIELGIQSSNLTMLASAAKIAAIIIVSGAILSGVGVAAAAAFAAIMGLIEAGAGFKNYVVKSSMSEYQITPVKLVIVAD